MMASLAGCSCSLKYTRPPCPKFVGYSVKDAYGEEQEVRTSKGPLCKACGHLLGCHGAKVEVEDAGEPEEWVVGEDAPEKETGTVSS